MDQIRFDFSTRIAATWNRNAPTSGDAADAFSQVLDQQLAQARDDAAAQDQDAPRTGADRRPADTAADRQPTARAKTPARPRDDRSSAQTATAKPKAAQKPTGTGPTSSDGKTGATAKAPAAVKSKQTDDPDDKKDTAVASQTSSDDATAKSAADKPTANADPDGQQGQQGDADKDPQAAQKPDADPVTEADLAGLMIPLPLQMVGAAANPKANGTADAGATNAALQAALLVAANLTASPVNLAADANAQAKAGASGLKFGAVIPDAAAPKTKAGEATTTAADNTGSDPSDPLTAATDPSKPIPVSNPAPKSQSNTASKPRGTATASSPVTNAYAGQNAAAAAAQPANAGIASAWSTRSGDPESLLPAPAVAGSADADLSAWYSSADGSGTASGAVSARTAAFLAQLKQNVQAPPAHEQIAIQIQKAMQNGSNRLTVSLQPAELGRVEIKLDVDKDKNVTAAIVVDRPTTLDLLQRDAKALERALQDAGLQTNDGSLSFSLRNGAGQGGGNGANGQTGAGIGGGNSGAPASDAADSAARAAVIATADGYVDLET